MSEYKVIGSYGFAYCSLSYYSYINDKKYVPFNFATCIIKKADSYSN